MLFVTFSSFSDKKRIFVPLAEAISVFLCLYIVTSGLMWIFTCFSVKICMLAVTFLDAVILLVRYLKSEIKGKEFFSFDVLKIDYRIIINKCAIVVAVFLSLGAFSSFGIGFNDGNAQTMAISILNGNNTLRFTIDEYNNIEPESKYEYYFFDTISNIDNEDFTADYWISDEGNINGERKMWVDFGANPVYPSLLALSSTIFGIGKMAFIQAVFAFCLFVFVDEILKTLKCDWKLRSILILLLGVSPIVVYCNHTTLVEPVIGFCMIMFVYFLLCKDNKLQLISAAGVVTFSFLHSSVYTMLPLFLVIYWMYYIHTRKSRHLIASGLSIAGYVLSFVFLNILAYENTSINYRIGLPFLGDKYYFFVIFIVLISLFAAVILLVTVSKAKTEKIIEFERVKGRAIFKTGVIVISIASIAIMVGLNVARCNSFNDTLHITVISFAICSGVIILPYIIARLISGSYNAGIKEAVIVVSFIYTILLYSAIMKVMLDGYYYEARYIASFIPFIILAAGMMLRLLKEDEKYYIPIIGIIILVIPYTTSLLFSKAETRLEKDIYDGVMQAVDDYSDENTVILVEKDLMKYFYFPVLTTTDAKVYPYEGAVINSLCLDTNEASSRVLYITNFSDNSIQNKGRIRYLKKNVVSEVNEEETSSILGLPNSFHEYNSDDIQVIEISNLARLIDGTDIEEIDMDMLDIKISELEIDESQKAHIKVLLTDGKTIYYNDVLSLSYHLEYENENVYDNPRTPIGPYVVKDYSFDFDLTNQDENMTVVFDIVEEGVQWYSWKNDVPEVLFSRNEDGNWEYTIEMRTEVN